MTARRALKWIHVASTVWFVLCVVYVLILALHQAGFNWWVIFSLSGHSLIAAFLLVSLYLFAFFRGVKGAQQIEVEHPLTSAPAYMGFYVAAPLIGGLAGLLGMAGRNQDAGDHAVETVSAREILVVDPNRNTRVFQIRLHQISKRNIARGENLYIFIHVTTSFGSSEDDRFSNFTKHRHLEQQQSSED